ncbi:glycosyltransferase family 2 protein [Cypionkella sp.]|uniref:glycosyltransferase n=1 Tax=Cypionkella sp. TaxID=2811411 RepID=UPI002715D749|nr:glycosyltransferase [Cypionkella sp.]MDO8982641.1 glycosyltransferase [Cypionkella sp.]MDP2049959.1 glycosyltransferase [Cypionkella sp.]
MQVDIGIFAHNEAHGIAAMVARLLAQDILADPAFSTRILVLANGCSDDTVAQVPRAGVEVVDLPEGGKSRTWNRFVHDLARADADVLVFVDADIEFCDAGAVRRLVQAMGSHWVINSQPVKDIVVRPEGLSVMDKIIAAAGGGLDDWKTAICGQLYAMPATVARRFHLPIGLPVEDGFLRAMVLTDALTGPEEFSRIGGAAEVFHIYASERSIGALIRHQVRIVIGSAVNFAGFGALTAVPKAARHAELARAAADAGWLGGALHQVLPRWPFGFVPGHFLTKRLARAAASPRDLLRPKRLLVTVLGFGFDLVVYCRAQWAMWRGTGVGHW